VERRFATQENKLGSMPHRRRPERHEGKGLRFSPDVTQKVFRLQNGISPITGTPIEQYHHKVPIRVFKESGWESMANTVQNCLGVSPIDHAFLHFCEWRVWGSPADLDAYRGQMAMIKDPEMIKLLEKMCRDEEKINEWGHKYRGIQNERRKVVIY
jgi:hypothetical protein